MNRYSLFCPDCDSPARLTTRGEEGMGGPSEAAVYVCQNYPSCDCYVGCHPGTDEPLGTLADKELRRLRSRAHKAFDWFWKSGQITRDEAYSLLAEHLGVSPEQAHIGMLDCEQCRSVVGYFRERPWKTPTV